MKHLLVVGGLLSGIAGLACFSPVLAHECDEEVYSVDQVLSEFSSAPFYPADLTETEKPGRSDFVIVRQVFMSNCKGRRLATVTIRNVSAGRRLFEGKQVMAVFADGSRRLASHNRVAVPAGEDVNVTLDFGEHSLPMMFLFTQN